MAASSKTILEELEMERIAIHPLPYSQADQDLMDQNLQRYGIKAISEEIMNIGDVDKKDNALARLCSCLYQMRVVDQDKYQEAGKLMWGNADFIYSLNREILSFLESVEQKTLESYESVTNVLMLFQCIAANDEVNIELVKAGVFGLLAPIIQLESNDEEFGKVQAIALSVFGILCQSNDDGIIKLAVDSGVLELYQCKAIINGQNQLSKRIAFHILEPILKKVAMHSIYPLPGTPITVNEAVVLDTLETVVEAMAHEPDPSPPLLFRIMKCYHILCLYSGGLKAVKEREFKMTYFQNTFQRLLKEYPDIQSLVSIVGNLTEGDQQ